MDRFDLFRDIEIFCVGDIELMSVGISMVIATKGRVRLLENLVKTIDIARKAYDGPTELIIVDDSSKEDAESIRKMCETYDASYLFLTPSVCAKRNLGARSAKYPIVLFLDSDCLVTENILSEHAKCYQESEKVGAVCGLLEFTGEDTKFWNAVSKSQFVVCFDMAKWGKTVPWGTTANFSVRKDVFESIDGFDENFPNKPGGEDVDFGLRIGKAGYGIAANPHALVYHDKATWTPVKAMFKRVWYYGSADTYVMDKHPDRLLGVMPRRTVLYGGSLILALILAVLCHPLCMILFPVWLCSDLIATSALMIRLVPYNRANFREQMIIQFLILTNELGFVYRCVQRKKPMYLFRQLAYFENQMKGIAFNASILSLCILINMLISSGVAFCILHAWR